MNNQEMNANEGKLAIWQKLLLIVVLMGSVFPVAVWQYGKYHTREIAGLQREAAGAKYIQALRQFNEQVTKHRGLTNSALHGNKDVRDQINLTEKSIAGNMQSILETDSQIMEGTTFGVILETADKVAALRKDWEGLKVKTQSQASAQEMFAGHNALLTSSQSLLAQVADRSGLTTDADLASNYLVRIAADAMPEAIDATEKVRSIMNGAALSKSLSAEDQTLLSQEGAKAHSALTRTESYFSKAVAANSETAGDIVSQQQQIASNALRECRAFLKKLEGFNAVNANAEQAFSEGARCLDRLFFVYDASTNSLVEILNRRTSAAKGERNSFLILICATFALFSLASLVLARQINTTFIQALAQKSVADLARANEAASHPAIEPAQAPVEAPKPVELLPAVAEVRATLEPVLSNESEELVELRARIGAMAEEVRAVLGGDLTVRVDGNEPDVCQLADSLNALIGKLESVVSSVNEVSTTVSTAAETTRKQTDQLVSRVQDQSQQILSTSTAVEEMTTAMRQVSQAALTSIGVAQKSLTTARQGAQALQDNVRGMNRVREQVVEASNQVRQLSESSREIANVLQLMDEIADQTSLLALNASIQAASAGDAGRGFSVVAQEIERLSERAADANGRISRVAKSVQMGAEKAISAMEENTREVIESAGLAWQANELVTEFEGSAVHLAELIQTISRSSRQGTAGSETLEALVGQMTRIMQETTAGIRGSAVAVANLTSLANDLKGSVASYKSPAQATGAGR